MKLSESKNEAVAYIRNTLFSFSPKERAEIIAKVWLKAFETEENDTASEYDELVINLFNKELGY